MVVAEAPTARDALPTLSHPGAAVVVICVMVDRDLARAAEIAALRLAGNVRIVCVSHWADAREVDATLDAGVLGCVELYDASDLDLKRAVHVVHEGGRYLSPGLPLFTPSREPGFESVYDRLTTREKEVLLRVAQSKSNREIARELNLSMNTVAAHRNKMMKKIGVRKATALAVYAAERGLLMRK
jgi:two-component system response regulator NreC